MAAGKRRRNGYKPYKSPRRTFNGGYKRVRYTPSRPYQNVRSGTAYKNLVTQGFLGIERKFYDTFLADAAITNPNDAAGGEHDPSATSMISTPVRGDSEQNRDGKQISVINCSIKGTVNIASGELDASPPEGTIVKVCLVLDTQTNGAQIVSENVFKNQAGITKMASNPMKNLLFMNRYRILKSQLFTMTPTGLSHLANDAFSHNGVIRQFDWFVPLHNMKINFNAGTTADIANVIDNSLHIIAYTSSVIGTPTLSYNARIRFVG